MKFEIVEGMENGRIKYEIKGARGEKTVFVPYVPEYSVCVYVPDVESTVQKEERKVEKRRLKQKREYIDKIISEKRRNARRNKAMRKEYNMGINAEEKKLAQKSVGFTVVKDEKDVFDLVDKAMISAEFLK